MKPWHVAMFLCCGSASATTVITESWNVSALIPDNTPTGWSDTRTLLVPEALVGDVQVYLHISGGFNGDLYAYLVHGSGFAVLLNRVGRTAANPDDSYTTGIDVIFSSDATGDAHTATAFTGPLQPDGRNSSPYQVTDADLRTALLTGFNGLEFDGSWTLFVADLSPTLQSTVVSWGLTITTTEDTVPEPATTSVTGLLALLTLLRRRR